ncbi:MAG TPA: HD domain-containing phosphohydrolase [Symbiobacteriaceae bacterium]|nr:HD domain-containing phosphohydrolase [Symbiobacteriaceae bacterium]
MPRSVHLLAWSLALAGTLLLAAFVPTIPAADLLSALGMAALAVLFERLAMTLPNRVNFSLGSTIVFLAYGVHGPGAAYLAEAAAAMVIVLKVKKPVQKVFNFGQFLVSAGGFHLVSAALGGGPLTLLAASLGFFVVNTFLLALVFRLATRRPFRDLILDIIQQSYVGVIGSTILLLPMLYMFRSGGWLALLLQCAGLLAFRYATNLYLEQKRVHLNVVGRLCEILEKKTGAAESHAGRVAFLARTMAEALKLPAEEVDTIFTAGLLHDVGEAEIDPRVVAVMARKVIPTLADREAYKAHPELGEALVLRMEGMGPVARLIRSHHEAWDGSGYPDGLSGDAIPLGARILAAAEVLEDLEGDRDAKMTLLPRLVGTAIDPGLGDVVSAALQKTELPAARAAAMIEDAGVAMLQNKLLQTVRSSQLLKTMGVGHVLSYDSSTGFTNFLGDRVEPPAGAEVLRLAREAVQRQLPGRQHVVDGGVAYDVYVIPAGVDAASVLLFDVTEALAVEREQTRTIFRAYRDVMSVVTGGRLTLIDEEESGALLAEGAVLGEAVLATPNDAALARALIEEQAPAMGFSQAEAFKLKVCVSEAVTNVFKHAGSGHFSLRLHDGALRAVISDRGQGIPYNILPRAILLEGYSTQKSLGRGFSVMLRFVDRLYVHTAGDGTVIVLERRPGQAASRGSDGPPYTQRGELVC